ncbi:U-box domain-containing protein 33 isoform X2 [Populus trichocarpa]|uniref:U-box domain-containing protein 33 isoform X2 n=1 Tax=Populus trichocarpa TaxID=3694 RepID=UPI000D1886C3|nr:U-box domain-containing protein 33 isoform X2 [Populus trichocarpa]|eukprot:XP_024451879.1 U-box domain-containing protein 33 isoform X2 [Populus trichocarpa]
MATIDAEISEESMSLAIDDIVYVAVGKDVGESKSTLLWALQNFSIKKVCLVHVHQPAKMIPLIGGNFPASRLEQHELREFRELERKIMHKVLDDYLLLCHRAAGNDGSPVQKGQICPTVCTFFLSNLVYLQGASHTHREQNSVEQLYKQLDRAMEEAEKFKREAFEESLIRGEAEKTSIKALRKAKVLGSLYAEELRHRKETEEALVKEKQEHGRTKDQRDETHLVAIDQRLLWETDRSKFDNKIKELGDEVLAYAEQCKEYEEERDELVKELSKKQAEDASSMHIHQLLSIFSLSEIEEASRNFDPSVKIGEGGYGNIYKGFLRHTPVAIKMLNPESMQGHAVFKQEVDVLSKLRHPHLVTLIGACSEACALIYEYLPNGNLEDRLNCEGNTPPLSWQVRIRIATELCSALIFLHSSTPTSIVHGDLKPGNVLLDANLSCKLSEFGICLADHNTRNITQYHKTDPEGTFLYLDPHFLTTGELSPKSDTYAFGIILLQLLTGRPEFGLVKEIRDVIDEENLTSLIDPLAGDWPFVQAMQLARLALKCCQMERSSRPDLASEVWSVLEPMRDSCGPLSRFQFGSLQCQTPPPYFICPILQEVMQDPHIAADGFTYEAEALRGWLESGHDTSPMTNLELERFELIPNHALRSVIQEWLQQH